MNTDLSHRTEMSADDTKTSISLDESESQKSVILTNKQLVSSLELFKIYILSLLLTEDTSKISTDVEHYRTIYGVSTMRYWKYLRLTLHYELVLLEKSPYKNPLKAKEPKRSTSLKKINKFMKKFYKFVNETRLMFAV